MKHVDIQQFDEEVTCTYNEETYSVRDNGSILRHTRVNDRKRPLDDKWIFGNPNKQSGYMHISKETVHRIVATAFHGPQPSEKHVVDHIDTNRRNNRPENLRWVTRLDNIILNEYTRNRIIYLYGSIDRFLDDPSKPINGNLDKNFEWMRTVTREEAANTRMNLLKLGRDGKISRGGTLGEWIFSNLHANNFDEENVNEIVESLTTNALQKNWKTPSEFPNCPNLIHSTALTKYTQNLIKGAIFSKNEYGQSTVEKSEVHDENEELFVLTRMEGVKPYGLVKVYIQDDSFIHENLGSFFEHIGALKDFTIAIGKEWDSGDTFDDLVS